MAWLAELMRQGMDFFFGLTGNYGVAIIVLTVLIRAVMLPFTWGQTRSLQKMQALQPELKKLQAKYKKDPQRLNKETMELWKKHGVNPLSGCLPLLIQLPFLWAFFRVLNDFEYVGVAGFLWIPDLARPDPLYILPLLAAVTTYWQSRASSPGGAADPTQRTMLYVFPVMIGWFSLQFAAGLSLYWVMSNILFIVQTILTRGSTPAKGEAAT